MKSKKQAKRSTQKSSGFLQLKRSYIWMGVGLLVVIVASLLLLAINSRDRQANFTSNRKVKTSKLPAGSTTPSATPSAPLSTSPTSPFPTTPSTPSTKIYTPPSPNQAAGGTAPSPNPTGTSATGSTSTSGSAAPSTSPSGGTAEPSSSQSGGTTGSSSSPSSGTVSPAGIWIPAQNTSWQWQLTSPVDQSVNVSVYDIDGFENSNDVVNSLHNAGRHVICYIDVGAAEDYRPDYSQFPAVVKGNQEPQWPGHYMLDVRRLDILGPIMSARLDMCKSKGFDAVEPDEADIYKNNSGFPLTMQDQEAYDRYIADAAHARGLSVGLKNSVDMVNDLLPSFDWTLNEQCFEFSECDKIMPFVSAGKAVFNTEYNVQPANFCSDANQRNFNSLYKKVGLDSYRVACR